MNFPQQATRAVFQSRWRHKRRLPCSFSTSWNSNHGVHISAGPSPALVARTVRRDDGRSLVHLTTTILYSRRHYSAHSTSDQLDISTANSVMLHNKSSDWVQRVLHITSTVPVGSMSTTEARFCLDAIDYLARRSYNSAPLAENILERYIQEAIVCPHVRKQVPESAYTRVIRAWAKSTNPAESEIAVNRVTLLLERMKSRHKEYSDWHPSPTIHTYNTVLYSYACAPASQFTTASALAERLIQSLEECVQHNKPNAIIPSTSLYNNVILLYSNRADTHYGAAGSAEDWLMHLAKISSSDGCAATAARPDTQSFNRVLKAWSISPENNAADRANEILSLMLKLCRDGHDTAPPDHVSFATVAHAYGRRGRPQEAEAVFHAAVDFFNQGFHFHDNEGSTSFVSRPPNNTSQVDLTNCLNAVLHAWVQSNQSEAPQRIENLIREAYALSHSLRSTSSVHVQPDAACHSCCLMAHIKLGGSEGIIKADQHLHAMVTAFHEGGTVRHVPAPTAGLFISVIHGWLRSVHPDRAQRADRLLRLMLQLSEQRNVSCAPDGGAFNMCIEMWSKQPGQTSRAIEVLDLAESRRQVSSFSYQAVINGLVREGTKTCVFQAAHIIERYEKQVDAGLIQFPSYDVRLYSLIVASLAKLGSPEASDRALTLLRGMAVSRGVKPTTRTYTGVLVAFSKLRSPQSGEIVYELYNEMKTLDVDPQSQVRLDHVVFAVVLETLARMGTNLAANRACEILSYMIKLHLDGREGVEPDSRCMDACLRAVTRVRDPVYKEQAVQLVSTLNQMFTDELLTQQPSQAGFHAVIRTCLSDGSESMRRKASAVRNLALKVCPPADQDQKSVPNKTEKNRNI